MLCHPDERRDPFPWFSRQAINVRDYYVYIMANMHHTIYIGVTNNLERRVYEHKQMRVPGFTKKYGLTDLVFYELFAHISDAIGREKQLKGWRREKKTQLIESMNPEWSDLSKDWYDVH